MMIMNKKTVGVVAVLVVGAAVALAGLLHRHDMTVMHMSNAAANATNEVAIQGYMFTPMVIKVKVGTTVTWTNHDGVNHTVTADTNSTDAPSSMDIEHGKSYTFTFKKAGTYTYHCFPHPFMHGTVEVTNS